MFLAELCVKRPVFTTMLIMALVVMGWFSYERLGLDLLPKIDRPTITVTTKLAGASPEEMETQVTKPIEEVVNTINGLEELRSSTSEGNSRVVAVFALERDPDVAAQDVRDKISTILAKFPKDTDPPIVEKFDPDSAPILAIVVSARRDQREITEFVDKKIKQPLETISGVGSITFVGDRKREIQVTLDPRKLAAYGVSIEQAKQAIERQNLEIPGGRVSFGDSEKVLRTMARVRSAEDFGAIIVLAKTGTPIRIRDLGGVVDGTEEARTISRFNGENAVSLLVRKQSGTNTVKVVDMVKERLGQIARTLPPDYKVLAAGVVFLFIRNLRSALIAAISIPTSIIATFTIMRALDFTLNNMTMLGLSLSTGIVIDDALVVLENIYRYIEEEGRSPMEAAVEATREIGLAVMATTLSLVVIFVPVAFMQGRIGRLFFSFGITAACAILVSLLVAFTLTPMLCSRFLKVPEANGAHHRSKESRFFRILERGYDRLLRFSLGHRPVVLGLAVLTAASTFWLYRYVGEESFVDDDQSEFEIFIQAPEGSSLERTDRILRQVEGEIGTLRGVRAMFTTVGVGEQSAVTDASLYVGLTPLREGTEFGRLAQHLGLRRLFGLPPLRERDFSQQDVMREARKIMARYPDLTVSVQNLFATGQTGARRHPFQLILRGPDLEALDRYSQDLAAQARTVPGLVDVDTTLARRKPEIRVHIDRDKAAVVGVGVDAIAGSLRTMVGGEEVTKFKEADDQYVVRLRLQEDFRKNAEVISDLYVPSAKLGLVKLNNVVRLSEEKGPNQIDRLDRERQVGIIANLDPRLPIGEAVKQMAPKVAAVKLPPGYTTKYLGRAQILVEARVNFLIALGLSLIFIYMILAAQFESFVHPLTIMASLPLSLPFGLLSLLVVGKTMNIFSAIGILMLFGVVKKNAILQVDYTNVLRERGLARFDAIIKADHARLRPILMTTLSIIAGMLPIALGKGDGSASRAAMATVVVGGQTLCLLLTLLVTPVLYTYFDDLQSLRVGKLLRLPDWFWERLRWIPSRVTRPPVRGTPDSFGAAEAPVGPPAGRPAPGG
ncbi:MAG: efflux RND transporter permease subunit [candidate division NC10 bacterium]|nr:efflux RND transporter permease subunit [candidate division NC10 bacterium]